jgi:ABC-type Fe3+/spermidine/putrescine transport system ATPase subunit
MAGRVTACEAGHLAIDWDGLALVSRAKDGIASGDPVEIYLKSERIALSSAENPPQGERGAENRLQGSVRDLIFKGHFSDYLIRVGTGAELVVSAPPALPGIARGGAVQLSWSDQAADVFEAPPGEPS